MRGIIRLSVLNSRLPVVISFAVELAVAHVTRVVQRNATHSAGQTVFVPARLANSHQVPIVDLLATALAQLVVLFALDCAHDYNIECEKF